MLLKPRLVLLILLGKLVSFTVFFDVSGHVCVFYSLVSMTVIQFDNQAK